MKPQAADPLVVFLPLTLSLACSAELPGHDRQTSRESTGAWTDATQWTVERDLTIGVVTGDSAYQFGHVVDVEATDDGGIYVLDQQAVKIRAYDADGLHVGSFARSGRGPGELSNNIPIGAQSILLTAADELVVPDPDNDRVSRFAFDGRFLGSFSLRMHEGRAVRLSALPGGDYVLHRASHDWNGLLRLNGSGEILDTVLEFPIQGVLPTNQRPIEALRHEAVWSVLSDGKLAWGVSDQSRVQILNLETGSEAVVTPANGEASPQLSRREQDLFLDRLLDLWAEMFRDRGESEAWIASQLKRGRDIYLAPERLPAFTGLAAGPEGTLWVRDVLPVDSMTREIVTRRSALAALAGHAWQVVARDGQVLGVVTLPPQFTLFRIRGTHIYGIERDQLGVQRVVRLRIELH